MTYQLWLGDCLQEMDRIEAGSVDMILADLPYGITECDFDKCIPFEPLWTQYKRVIKKNGAIVLFGSQPFTSLLILSNFDWFKYCWYWHKNIVSGFQLAKIQPTRAMEEICIFYQSQPTYNRQPTESLISDRKRVPGALVGYRKSYQKNNHKLGTKPYPNFYSEHVAPRNVLEIPCVPRATGTLHPAQKPVALLEYLIKTYTNPGELVLDNVMGSGSTSEACINTERQFIGIEKDADYYQVAVDRLERVIKRLTNRDLPLFEKMIV